MTASAFIRTLVVIGVITFALYAVVGLAHAAIEAGQDIRREQEHRLEVQTR